MLIAKYAARVLFLWRVIVYWVNSDLVRFMCISYNQQMFLI